MGVQGLDDLGQLLEAAWFVLSLLGAPLLIHVGVEPYYLAPQIAEDSRQDLPGWRMVEVDDHLQVMFADRLPVDGPQEPLPVELRDLGKLADAARLLVVGPTEIFLVEDPFGVLGHGTGKVQAVAVDEDDFR